VRLSSLEASTTPPTPTIGISATTEKPALVATNTPLPVGPPSVIAASGYAVTYNIDKPVHVFADTTSNKVVQTLKLGVILKFDKSTGTYTRYHFSGSLGQGWVDNDDDALRFCQTLQEAQDIVAEVLTPPSVEVTADVIVTPTQVDLPLATATPSVSHPTNTVKSVHTTTPATTLVATATPLPATSTTLAPTIALPTTTIATTSSNPTTTTSSTKVATPQPSVKTATPIVATPSQPVPLTQKPISLPPFTPKLGSGPTTVSSLTLTPK
jgi:hypothetical protein